jgi:hypothetical protein
MTSDTSRRCSERVQTRKRRAQEALLAEEIFQTQEIQEKCRAPEAGKETATAAAKRQNKVIVASSSPRVEEASRCSGRIRERRRRALEARCVQKAGGSSPKVRELRRC